MGTTTGQESSGGGTSKPPLKDKGKGPAIGTATQGKMHVKNTAICDAAEGPSIIKVPMRGASFANLSVDTQGANLGLSQPEGVDEAAPDAMVGRKPMEGTTMASKASEQAMPTSLPTEQESIAQDHKTAEHEEIQAAHTETAEASLKSISTAEEAGAQLQPMKPQETIQPASQTTPSVPASSSGSTRNIVRIKLNFTPKSKVKDSEAGGPSSSSAALTHDTGPSKSETREGGIDDETVKVHAQPADSEEEVVLLTEPPEGEGAGVEQQVEVADERGG